MFFPEAIRSGRLIAKKNRLRPAEQEKSENLQDRRSLKTGGAGEARKPAVINVKEVHVCHCYQVFFNS